MNTDEHRGVAPSVFICAHLWLHRKEVHRIPRMIERMSLVTSFRARDLGVDDVETATLLARFLTGAGVLALG